jgi:hypothetical protein
MSGSAAARLRFGHLGIDNRPGTIRTPEGSGDAFSAGQDATG